MYACNQCKELFEKEDALVKHTTYESLYGVTGQFANYTPLTLYYCPHCYSEEFDEAIECQECGDYYHKENIEEDLCEDCTAQLRRNKEMEWKQLSIDNLRSTSKTFERTYSTLYDKVRSEEHTRDDVWVYELHNLFNALTIVPEVYVRDNKIHPSYALEKLRYIQARLQNHIAYWESKEKEK